MKRSLFLLVLMMFCTVGFAQLSFNAKVGMNLSSHIGSNSDYAKFKPGFRAGVGLEYQFTDIVSLQPSLFFSQKGAKISEHEISTGVLKEKTKQLVNQLYLEIPVNVQFRFEVADNINVLFATGPYFACGVGGKMRTEIKASVAGKAQDTTTKTDTFGDKGLNYNRFDAGWDVGVGVEINRIIVGLDTQFGFCTIKGEDTPHNANIGISLGYNF